MTLLERYDAVRARVDAACVAAGRDPVEVDLLPVSKTHPVGCVQDLYAAGRASTFGENKVQELLDKAEACAGTGVRWAVIGHLQTNKAREVARVADEFQALDSLKLADALDRRLQAEGRGLDVYLQINSSGEDSKFGVAPAEAAGLARSLGAHSALRVVGLMTLASPGGAEVARACFERVVEVQRRLRQDDRAAGSYDRLSMGMSGDFETAIACGSTVVRVGTAIFGAREYA